MKKAGWICIVFVLAMLLAACSTLKPFSIEGKWKNIGSEGIGQAQPGAIVVFDGTNCNFCSPKDTYALVKDGGDYRLECTTFLFAETLTYSVKVINNDRIDISSGSRTAELERVK